jgi:hypothetical protein
MVLFITHEKFQAALLRLRYEKYGIISTGKIGVSLV